MSAKNFFSSLPQSVQVLFQEVVNHGGRVGCIGGATRDYLLLHKLSFDIDCEVRATNINDFWNMLETLLSAYDYEKLSFDILRVKIEGYEIEFSKPRLENYTHLKGHKNFDATFIDDLDYEQGFQRRDFSMNAIMFELSSQGTQLIDPYDGIDDLAQRTLKACSESFTKDPVRFLRAIRFHVKYTLQFDKALEELLKQMSLEAMSYYYIKNEMVKSGDCSAFICLWLTLRSDSMWEPLRGYRLESKSFDSFIKEVVFNPLLDRYYRIEIRDFFHLSHKKYKIFDDTHSIAHHRKKYGL